MTVRRIPILLSLAAYLAAGVVAGLHLTHDHGHHRPVLSNDLPATAHHCGCEHHAHGDSGSSNDSHDHPHRHPPDHDEDACHVCQFLVQKPLPVTAVAIVELGEAVEHHSEISPQRPDSPLPALPFSRAPPAQV